MTTRELHIEINQSLQKVAANLTRKFLSEEIDWVLNKVQHRFIQQCLRPVQFNGNNTGQFRYADQLRTDALKNLVVSGKEVTAYKDSDKRIRVYLPDNYMYMLADASNMVNLCGETRVETSTPKTITTLKLSKSTLSIAPYYATGVLNFNGTTFTIPTDLNIFNSYTGYVKKEDVNFLKDWLLYQMQAQGINVYWEYFGDLYRPNCFIFDETITTLTLTWDSVAVTSTTSEVLNLVSQSTALSTTHTADNRLTSSYDIPSLQNSPFYVTSRNTPISELSNKLLYVYQDENTTVKSVNLSYIRTPQPISLSLATNCELDERFHQSICDLVVEYIKGQMEDPQGFQLKQQDNNTRVIL
jgi:hypothetical protein